VLPNAVCAALAGATFNAGKMPLADFCNRPTARAPEMPLDSLALNASRRLGSGGGPVDAVPSSFSQASDALLFRRGAPHRSDAALRAAFSAAHIALVPDL
jgi:hypothetical protein